MGRIYTSSEQLIGGTPLLELTHIEKALGLKATICAKLECFNPAGSAKDRVGKAMIDEAEASGKLKPGYTIIEPTSGNTGIGLAAVAATRGYKVKIIMPDTMSAERIKMMRAYGAEVILTDGAGGMAAAIAKAEELAAADPGSFIAGQFVNPVNPQIHYQTTGPEIYEDTDGKVDIFIAGVGTGGTLTGVGRFLKEQDPKIRVIAVEPDTSAVLSGESAGAHGIQGIGGGFIPEILDTAIYDDVIRVTDGDAISTGKLVNSTEGILVGISSGAAVWAAIREAEKPENEGKLIVALLPDGGDRYVSTALFE